MSTEQKAVSDVTVEVAKVFFDKLSVDEFRNLIKERGHLGVVGHPRYQIGDVVTNGTRTGVVAGVSINSANLTPVWRYDVHMFECPIEPTSSPCSLFANEEKLTLISGS